MASQYGTLLAGGRFPESNGAVEAGPGPVLPSGETARPQIPLNCPTADQRSMPVARSRDLHLADLIEVVPVAAAAE